ncbi:MAG: VOC family protein [Candidatus Kapaibacterium sp.]
MKFSRSVRIGAIAKRTVLAQVSRGSNCKIILATDLERGGSSHLFISLENDEMARLREEIETRSIPVQHSWWGYEVLVIVDPDGNELMFPTDV